VGTYEAAEAAEFVYAESVRQQRPGLPTNVGYPGFASRKIDPNPERIVQTVERSDGIVPEDVGCRKERAPSRHRYLHIAV